MGLEGFFPFFCFSSLFSVFLFFLCFLSFSSFFSYFPRTRANDCNLLGKWGISLRPRLHRPRSELPELERAMRIDVSSANCSAKSTCRVRISVRNPIFRCPPLRPPDGPRRQRLRDTLSVSCGTLLGVGAQRAVR